MESCGIYKLQRNKTKHSVFLALLVLLCKAFVQGVPKKTENY